MKSFYTNVNITFNLHLWNRFINVRNIGKLQKCAVQKSNRDIRQTTKSIDVFGKVFASGIVRDESAAVGGGRRRRAESVTGDSPAPARLGILDTRASIGQLG